MTDRNGQPLKVGDKVTSSRMPVNHVGEVYSIGGSYLNVKFDPREITLCDPRDLTIVELAFKKGDKVTHSQLPGLKGEVDQSGVTDYGRQWFNVMFDDGLGRLGCNPEYLTLVEPEPKKLDGLSGDPENQAYRKGFNEGYHKALQEAKANKPAVEQVHKVEPNGEVVPLAEPKPEPVGYKSNGTPINLNDLGNNVFEDLELPNAAELYAKAELVSRVREIMGKFERKRFPEIADEILRAVSAYHERA